MTLVNEGGRTGPSTGMPAKLELPTQAGHSWGTSQWSTQRLDERHGERIKIRGTRSERGTTNDHLPTTGEVSPPRSPRKRHHSPPQDSDAVDLGLTLDNPRVYRFLLRPLSSHRPHHRGVLGRMRNNSDNILENFGEGETVVGGCLVQHMRTTSRRCVCDEG